MVGKQRADCEHGGLQSLRENDSPVAQRPKPHAEVRS